MYTPDNNTGLPGMPLRGMLSSILPFLAIATPSLVLAAAVTNTATITVPGGVFESNTADNTASDSDTVYVEIVATDDTAIDVTSGEGILNVFGNDTVDGAVAGPDNSVLSLPPGTTLPDGIGFDPATGLVSVAPGTPPGEYTFDYQICQIDAPDNCAIATARITVIAPPATLSGTIYLDSDGDRLLEDGEPRLDGWIVEVRQGDTIVATTVSDANGYYEITGLPGGEEYSITFRHPTTGVVYEVIDGIVLENAATLPDQNLPIDPSGVVYDAITRAPVSGARLTMVDASGNPLPNACFVDSLQQNQVTDASGDYRFDIVPGGAAACPEGETEYVIEIAPPAGYSFASTVIAPQNGSFDPTGRPGPVQVDSVMTAPTGANPIYYLSFLLENGDPDVINNHVPLEPEQSNGNRELVWRDQVIPANSSVIYNLTLIVGAGVTEGQAVNTGVAENGAGGEISNRGTATVSIIPSTVFDCSELIGQVFVDANGNGYQDQGERGIPSVRLATVKGELITTDEFGRYHIACAAVPDARIGSNYVLKVDEASLPDGWVMTTDNPRSIRLTRGKMGELNFGAALALQASMRFEAKAFGPDGSLKQAELSQIEEFAADRDSATLIRAIYSINGSETPEQITQRLTSIKEAIEGAFARRNNAVSPVVQVHAVSASKLGEAK